jgi:hypothetical protein
MKPAAFNEYLTLIVASLVFTIVLVTSFMCMQLYHFHKPRTL